MTSSRVAPPPTPVGILTFGDTSVSENGSLDTLATTHPTSPKTSLDPQQLNPAATPSCSTSSTTAGRSADKLFTSPPRLAAAPFEEELPREACGPELPAVVVLAVLMGLYEGLLGLPVADVAAEPAAPGLVVPSAPALVRRVLVSVVVVLPWVLRVLLPSAASSTSPSSLLSLPRNTLKS